MGRKQVDPDQRAKDEIAEAKKANKTELSITTTNLDLVREACEITTLTRLSLSGGLTELPPEIGNLVNIERLSIESNQLTTLPKEIGKLVKLQSLYAYSNKFRELPDEIGGWVELRKAVLWSNELIRMPGTISAWKLITELELKRNKLAVLPDAIGDLPALEELEIDSNELTELPRTLGGLVKLHRLAASRNQFATFPVGVLDIPNLRELDLQRNKLTSLPDSISRMKRLEVLELQDNQITALPAGLFSLTALTKIDLAANQLTSIPKEIGALVELQELDVGRNPIEGIPEEVIELGKDGIFRALGLAKPNIVEGDLPEPAERAALVKQLQPRLDDFQRQCKKKSHPREILPKLVEFLTGKTNEMPPIRRDDHYGFSHLPEALAEIDAWTFFDRRIIAFIAKGAFYYRQPNHTYMTGYHKELFSWLSPKLKAEAAGGDLFGRVAAALREGGVDEDGLLRGALRELDELMLRDDGTPTSFGRWLLAQVPHRLDAIKEIAADRGGVRDGLLGLLIRNDMATFGKISDRLLALEPNEEGNIHVPHGAYEQLCAVDPVRYAPMVLDAAGKAGCIACQAEIAKVLAEQCGPEHRARAFEIATTNLAAISERRNKEDRLWFSFGGQYGDGLTSYVDWVLQTFGADARPAVVKFAEDTKVFDLDVAEVIAKHLKQDGVAALVEGLDMTFDSNDIAPHFRRMFTMLAPLDWSAYHEKAWELARSEHREVRQTACLALSRLDPATVLPKALAMMDENKAHLREAGVLIATLLPGDPANKQLDALLADEASDDVRDLVVAQRFARDGAASGGKVTVADIDKRIASAKERGKLAKPVAKWLDEKKLGSLVWKGGKKLTPDGVRWLLQRQTRLGDIGPEAEARAAYGLIDRAKSAAFASKLLALAVKNGGISAKTRFALSVVGLTGDDDVIETLEETAIDGKNENAAAVLGLLGSMEAARALDRVIKAFRTKYPNVREAAQDAFDRIAAEMKISRFELADQMLSDFGFDKGVGSIALGKVKAKVTFGLDRKLQFADAKGVAIKSPGKGLTGKSKEALEALRDQVDESSRALRSSLEYYLVCGRRWPVAKWKAFFLGNPLAMAFAQSLVWVSGDVTFRVAASGKLVGADGTVVKPAAEVSLAHPLDLDDAARDAWIAGLKQAGLEQPFNQMARPIFAPKPVDQPRARSFEFENKELNGLTFKSRAERLGWRRGSVVDSGAVSAYRKLFERHQIEAFIGTENLGVTSYDGDSEVTLAELFFVKAGSVVTGSYTYDEPRDDGDPRLIKLGDVPAIVYSETIADLHAVTREKTESAEA